MNDQAARKAAKPSEDDEEERAAKEWLDQQAAFIGGIWIRRFPTGRDW